MKKILALFGLLVLIVVLASFFQKYLKDNTLPFVKKPVATINNHRFSITLARTDKEKQVGLSDKKSMPQDNGMLFVFEKPNYYSLWMKNMKFPIDMIFIKKNKITTICESISPPKAEMINTSNLPIYKPEEESDMVLEINAGLSEKFNFKKGDEVKFENL